MKTAGYFETVGQLEDSDLLPMIGQPGIVLTRANGRRLVLVGLTETEVREAARAGFMEDVTLTLAKAAA
jgi:hypothetical protein